MGTVSLNELQQGDTIDRATVNAVLTNLLTEDSNVDGSNVRDGGLDERNFADGSVTDQPSGTGIYTYDGSPSHTVNTATLPTAPMQPGGTEDMVAGPYDIDNTSSPSDRWLVFLSLQLDGQVSPSAGDLGQYRFQIGYSTDYDPATLGSGTWSLLTKSLRDISTVIAPRMNKSFSTVLRFDSSVQSSNVYFGVFAYDADNTSTQTINIDNCVLYAINFKR